QNPGEFGHLGHVALPEGCAAIRIETASEKIQCYSPAIGSECFRIIDRRERVIIGDEIKRLALCLERNCRPHHPEIISDVKNAGGLNAGKNAHGLEAKCSTFSARP